MVTDILMNITSQLLTMGLPSIDQSLDKLLVAMETFPKSAVLGNTVGYARVIGLCLALCVGSYECWMMMLGRRAMDVMKLLRIVGLSICITYSSWICQELARPGKALEATTKQMASSKNKEVAALELKVAQKQSDYLKRLRQVQDSIETAKQVQEIGEDAHWWDKLIYNMENLGSTINNYAQRATVAAERSKQEANFIMEAKAHIQLFHQYFFNLPPDDDYIKWTLSKAMYMADGTALKQKQAMEENGFYSDIISSSAVCMIICDSIKLDEHTRKFKYYGTQIIKRRSRDMKRSLITVGSIENVPRTRNNPHGLLITNWRTLENKDLDYSGYEEENETCERGQGQMGTGSQGQGGILCKEALFAMEDTGADRCCQRMGSETPETYGSHDHRCAGLLALLGHSRLPLFSTVQQGYCGRD